MKSRQKPNADMEIGYHAALPCLLALEALHQGKTLGWDAAARKRRSRPRAQLSSRQPRQKGTKARCSLG